MMNTSGFRRVARIGRAALLFAFVVAGVLALGAPEVSAHAVIMETNPRDGEVLDVAPEFISMGFNESVRTPTDGVRVYDANASRVDNGTIPTDDPREVRVALPDDLDDGVYIVAWRVISADSHPVSGVFAFTLGEDGDVDDELVAELVGGDRPVITGLGMILRGAGYGASLLAAGALAFGVFVVRRHDDVGAARRIMVRAAWTGVVVAIVALPVQASAATGRGLGEVLISPNVLGETITSSFGVATATRVAALLVLVALARARLSVLGLAVPAAVVLGSYLLDGHQRTYEPAWALIGGDVVHLLTAAIWFAGLILLAGVLRRRTRADDPVETARVVSRFSSLAFLTFVAVAASGTVMAWALVRTPSAITTTTYGWTLVAKLSLVAIVLLLAAYNRFRLVPVIEAFADADGRTTPTSAGEEPAGKGSAGEGSAGEEPAADGGFAAPDDDRRRARLETAWERLGRVVRAEATILIVLLIVTGALVSIRPAADVAGQTGLFQQTVSLTDTLEVDLVVDPNRAGRNTIHAYVLESGRPSQSATDLTLELTFVPEDIGPIEIVPFFAGPGHWIATGDELAFPGAWSVDVIVGEGRFERHRVTIPVTVAG